MDIHVYYIIELTQAITTHMRLSLNELYCPKPQKTANVVVFCCKCVEDNTHIFKNKVLVNRIHKCRIVDTLTKTQYIEMYERMKNKQIETYDKYMGKIKDDIDFKNKRKERHNKYYRKRMANKQQAEHNANYFFI